MPDLTQAEQKRSHSSSFGSWNRQNITLHVLLSGKYSTKLGYYKEDRYLYVFLLFQSPVNAETGSAHDETSSSGNKDDEDDDDDESDDKIDTQPHDPERLKAFNVSTTYHIIKGG